MEVEQRLVARRAAQHAAEAGRLGAHGGSPLVMVRDVARPVEVHLVSVRVRVRVRDRVGVRVRVLEQPPCTCALKHSGRKMDASPRAYAASIFSGSGYGHHVPVLRSKEPHTTRPEPPRAPTWCPAAEI